MSHLHVPHSAEVPHWFGQRGREQSRPAQAGGQVQEEVAGSHLGWWEGGRRSGTCPDHCSCGDMDGQSRRQ